MVVADSEQFLWFYIFDLCVCRCVDRLYWLRARSHHSRATFHGTPPKSTLEATLLNPCVVARAGPVQAQLSGSEASASVWACGLPLILYPLPPASSFLGTVDRKRMENGDAGGLSNMTEVGFCF